MSSNSEIEDHRANIVAWKEEPVLNLANHFHTFCEETSQHKRVHHFEISQDALLGFTDIESIEDLKICLAIKANGADNDFRFYPILEISDSSAVNPESYFPLEPTAVPDKDGFNSEFVPGVFKEMVLENWNKLDITYIDDLFIAQARDDDGNLLSQMVRVHEFHFTNEMIRFIDSLNTKDENGVANITNIKLYPGVDMNKFGNTEYISFTPVLSITHTNPAPAILSHPGSIEVLVYETLIEYTLPCPPCRKKK